LGSNNSIYELNFNAQSLIYGLINIYFQKIVSLCLTQKKPGCYDKVTRLLLLPRRFCGTSVLIKEKLMILQTASLSRQEQFVVPETPSLEDIEIILSTANNDN
jgi:hypothetical protein